MVPPSRGLPNDMLLVASVSRRSACHQVQQLAITDCFTSSRPPGHGHGTQPVLEGSGYLCHPTGRHLGQSGGEVTRLPMQQEHSDCSWVVQHPLSLGPGGHVQPDPIVPAQPAQSVDSAVQLDPSQESVKHDSSCLTPRASAIKDQGFSAALAARIKAPE